jgi:hypothetical protein
MAALVAPSGPGRPLRDGGDGGWRAHIRLSVPGFAWEFLRRNPAYRREYQALSDGPSGFEASLDRRWGLRFAANPALPADQADVFWRPEVAPGLVVALEPARDLVGGAAGLTLPDGAARLADEGLHVRLAAGLQLLLRGQSAAAGPLVVMLAFDADFGLRVRAVETLRRAATGGAAPRSRLTTAQRTRLARCLVALDGSLRRESYRDIARSLFGANAVEDEAWKTASIRGVTIRLVQAGRALMDGGYLSLLHAGL